MAHGADTAVSSINKPRAAVAETATEMPTTKVEGEEAAEGGDAPADNAE